MFSLLSGRVRRSLGSAGKKESSYLSSKPKQRDQFSNISDSEYPLQPIYGNQTTAWSNTEREGRRKNDIEDAQEVRVETRFEVDST